MFEYDGSRRPPFAVEAGPGQESVWDYPRPPRVENVTEAVRVVLGGHTITNSSRAVRVIETAGAPVYYVPLEDVEEGVLKPIVTKRTWCEWKGEARYFDVVANSERRSAAAFAYPNAEGGMAPLQDMVGFYVAPMDACYVGEEKVRPQPGGFYAGWVRANLVGPIKGEPGTGDW